MSKSIGKLSEFNVNSDNWKLYVERLEQYFIVNNISRELYVPTLTTVVGAECYELMVNLCTPTQPKAKTFAELTSILEKHLQPRPSVLCELYTFRQRKQNTGESLAEYMAALKKMSKFCEFGAGLEENLRDQFVCGISSETIRQRLFTEDKLEYDKAYKLAVSMEGAEKNAAIVEGATTGSGSGTASVPCQAVAAGRRDRPRDSSRWDSRWRDSGRRDSSRRDGGTRNIQGPRDALATADQSVGAHERRERCRACDGAHDTSRCRFARYVCRVCNKQGHLRRVCPYLAGQHAVHVTAAASGDERRESDGSDEVIVYPINDLSVAQYKPIYIKLNIHNRDIAMECDTGSAVSCMNLKMYEQFFKDLEIKKSRVVLRYYTGETVRPLGVIRPLVKYKNREKYLDLYIIRDGNTVLLGRQWLEELQVQLPSFENTYHVNNVNELVFNLREFSSRYCKVFADGLGRFTGGSVGIHVREGARPVFLRARPLAYALREPVERALEQLVRDGILTPVERSDWATPIVPVVKKDGNIRICADYKLTLNKVLEVDRYPLPRVEDLLVRLHGGTHFSKIDLSQAYAQLELDESRKYTVINTHKGLFRYNRLVYGLSSSPGIFQRHLEQLFSDIPHVGVFLDDVIITGKNTREHINNLHEVFKRLEASRLRVKKEKCVFFEKSLTYLGHTISKDGVHTCPDKVNAIRNTPAPQNITQLRAFIGMVMYYGKFIKNVSTVLAPLYGLLRAGVKYVWNGECDKAFHKIKECLSSCAVLAHYSPELPLVLTVDASSVGVGAVLAHHTPAGERPVAYASRTLSAAERGYAQIDKEALAIVYGVRKFHQYLYGRKFILRTDHKPLTYIFGNKVGIPVMAAARVQRWALLLSGYNYEIEYVRSSDNCADALSRMPVHGTETGTEEVTYVNFVEDFLPITNSDVRRATEQDKLLSKVVLWVQAGWPPTNPDELSKPYYIRRNELYIDRGCLMWGYRIVIPSTLKDTVLKQLHVSHMGIVKTKSLARSYVWWPNVDMDVERVCKECEICAAEAQAPPRAPPQSWPYVTEPWSRLHVDFLGPYKGRTFLVIIDASSKWLEIFEMKRTNASAVIGILRATFARFGLPKVLVSDQGPPFTSTDFREFLEKNGVRQCFSPAYHPASNGLAENAVKVCKRAIKKAERGSIDLDEALQTFLLAYRNSIHSTTGDSPAMLLQRRSLRSRLDLLRSDRALEDRVHEAQRHQVRNASRAPLRELAPGDAVWAREYGGDTKWTKGSIVSRDDTRRYVLERGDGQLVRRHIDQLKRRSRMSDVSCSGERETMATTAAHGAGDAVARAVPGGEAEGENESEASPAKITREPDKPVTPTASPPERSPPRGTPGTPVLRPRRTRKPVIRFPE